MNELEISDEYRQFEINLESFMNQTPFVATAEMDAAQVFSMFRGLGLRHLPILDQTDGKLSLVSTATRKKSFDGGSKIDYKNAPVKSSESGMITRHDLTEENIHSVIDNRHLS